MKRYILSPPALQDIKAIIDYFETINLTSGETFLQEFNALCQKLRSFPLMGKRYDNLLPNLRGRLIGKYIVFYLVTDDVVEIVRVIHGQRDLDAQFNHDKP